MVTVAPASAVPVTVVPSGATAATGGAGAVRSGATSVTAGEALPAASVCTTVSVWRSICGVASVTANRPRASTLPLPSSAPLASRIAMAAPASPVPLTTAPEASSVGAGGAGGVMSGAVSVTGSETLPAASVCTAVTVPPFAAAGLSGTVALPSLPIVAWPITPPPGPVTVTVAPASPVTCAEAPSPASVTTGASGGMVSGAVSVTLGEGLPAASLCTTAMAPPLLAGGISTTVIAPSTATVPLPMTLLVAPVTVTRAPGSPLPDTIVPSSLIDTSGAAGGVISGAATFVSGERLPAASVCTTVIVPPLAAAGESAIE